MKRTFLLILAIAAFSYSCDKVLNFTINHTFEESFDVVLDESADTTFSEMFTIDAADNQEIANNINNISGYTITGLTLSISDYIGGDTISGAFLVSFKNSSGNQVGGTIELTVDNLAGFAASGDKADINPGQATVDAIQAELVANNAITIVVDGSVSEVPVSFKAHVFLTVDVGVSP